MDSLRSLILVFTMREGYQMASSPRSSLRTRMTSFIGLMKILPSPVSSLRDTPIMVSQTRSTAESLMTISN